MTSPLLHPPNPRRAPLGSRPSKSNSPSLAGQIKTNVFFIKWFIGWIPLCDATDQYPLCPGWPAERRNPLSMDEFRPDSSGQQWTNFDLLGPRSGAESSRLSLV
ncbi:hypothetical protein AVEN_178799-1 [Araneus ventricosus]|uniref:Uncharacterized protein n=1 Tax=Araneus ventricosus TaxID=182803 RepID=A0A4Y2BE80_ARAVE|nr:hypothetical protein AVEN_178799-1 [Araneus ventricosus]